jgi:hypothetical protein
MKTQDGKAVRPPALPFWHDHFVSPGVADLDLSPGTYSYELDRGPEYLVTTGKVVMAESAAQTITNSLRRLVDLSREGWWSGELHVHRPVADIELLMQAEDLHVAPVITWWNNRNVWAGFITCSVAKTNVAAVHCSSSTWSDRSTLPALRGSFLPRWSFSPKPGNRPAPGWTSRSRFGTTRRFGWPAAKWTQLALPTITCTAAA